MHHTPYAVHTIYLLVWSMSTLKTNTRRHEWKFFTWLFWQNFIIVAHSILEYSMKGGLPVFPEIERHPDIFFLCCRLNYLDCATLSFSSRSQQIFKASQCCRGSRTEPVWPTCHTERVWFTHMWHWKTEVPTCMTKSARVTHAALNEWSPHMCDRYSCSQHHVLSSTFWQNQHKLVVYSTWKQPKSM